MNEKRLWIGIIAGGSLAAIGCGFLVHMEYGNIDTAKQAVANLRGEISASRKLLTGTTELEREVIVLRETEETIKEILPDEQDVNNLVRDLSRFKEDSGVQITGLKKKPPEIGKKDSADFDKVAYQLTFEAEAFQLMDFMDRVETHSRFMRIPNVKLTAATRKQNTEYKIPAHKVQMDVETYVYQPQSGPQPVKIEGYDRKRELLLGEINRRRQALMIDDYEYRGPQGRRDPWVDPRVPADGPDSGLPVEEQIRIVQDMVERTAAAIETWEAVKSAGNVIVEITKRAELEQQLSSLEEDLRRELDREGIRFVQSKRRLQLEVVEPLEALKDEITESEGGHGPSRDALRELYVAMWNHVSMGEYQLAIDAFSTVEDRLGLAEVGDIRQPLINKLRKLNSTAHIAADFSKIDMEIRGVAVMEGVPPVALINGKTLGEGDLLGDELVIRSIRPGAIEFIFRGLILERRF